MIHLMVEINAMENSIINPKILENVEFNSKYFF